MDDRWAHNGEYGEAPHATEAARRSRRRRPALYANFCVGSGTGRLTPPPPASTVATPPKASSPVPAGSVGRWGGAPARHPPRSAPPAHPPGTAEASRVAPPRTPPPSHPLSTQLKRTPSRQGAASPLPGQPSAAMAQLARPHLPSRRRAGRRGQSARRRRGVGGRGGTNGVRGGRGAAAAAADAPPFRRVVTRPSASPPAPVGPFGQHGPASHKEPPLLARVVRCRWKEDAGERDVLGHHEIVGFFFLLGRWPPSHWLTQPPYRQARSHWRGGGGVRWVPHLLGHSFGAAGGGPSWVKEGGGEAGGGSAWPIVGRAWVGG